ncbi:MAG: hypothetical protein QF416_00100, partial [Candidatus Marinimicrobia bacterium]|nr:hypothetical protein [Candidatus Neomarinimicrobiota bacterium]
AIRFLNPLLCAVSGARHGDAVLLQMLYYRVGQCGASDIAEMYQRIPKARASLALQGECQMIPAEPLRSTVIPDAGGLSRAISNQGLQKTATLDFWVFA